MVRKRWVAVALAAVVIGAAAPPGGPAAAAGSPDRATDGDSASLAGHQAMSTMVSTATATPAAAIPTATDVGIQKIFGPDDRVPITDTTTYPASANVLLTFSDGSRCTGFMISQRTVATAGHCVHTGGSYGRWRTDIVAYPAHDGTTAPFGACAGLQLFAPAGWAGYPTHSSGADPAYDYGAVRLNCAVGSQTGWHSIPYTTQPLTGSCTVSQGYPRDRSGLWASADTIRAENSTFLYVQHDLVSGQDGSAVEYRPPPDDPDDGPCPGPRPPICPCPQLTALGILTSGPDGIGPGISNNIAIRITPAVAINLMQWR